MGTLDVQTNGTWQAGSFQSYLLKLSYNPFTKHMPRTAHGGHTAHLSITDLMSDLMSC